jgi:DNA-binding MarR family transcriptional regulator
MPNRGLLDSTLGLQVARASVVAYEAFEQHIGHEHDLRKVDFPLLMLLAEHARLAPKRLVAMLSLTAPKLSVVLDRMQARGLIERRPDLIDRRSVEVMLTADGLRMAKTLEPVARRMEQGLKKRLSAADHARLIELLRKLTHGSASATG